MKPVNPPLCPLLTRVTDRTNLVYRIYIIQLLFCDATMVQVDGDHMCHNFRGHNNVTYLKHMDITCYCFHHISEVSAMHACEILPQFDGLVPEIHNSIANALALRLSWTNPSNWWQHYWWILLGLHWVNPIYGYCNILERTQYSVLRTVLFNIKLHVETWNIYAAINLGCDKKVILMIQ